MEKITRGQRVQSALRKNPMVSLACLGTLAILGLWLFGGFTSGQVATLAAIFAVISTLLVGARADRQIAESNALTRRANEINQEVLSINREATLRAHAPLLEVSTSSFSSIGGEGLYDQEASLVVRNVGLGVATNISMQAEGARIFIRFNSVDVPSVMTPGQAATIPVRHNSYGDVVTDPKGLINGPEYLDRTQLVEPIALSDSELVLRYEGMHGNAYEQHIRFERIVDRDAWHGARLRPGPLIELGDLE